MTEERVTIELPRGEAQALWNELTYRAEEKQLSRFTLAALEKFREVLSKSASSEADS